MTTDDEAEPFLGQDPSNLDFAAFKPLIWQTEPKSARVNMQLPAALMKVVKTRATERDIPYQRLICEAIKRAVWR